MAEGRPLSEGYRAEMLAHATAGKCLRNYALLTDCPEVAAMLGLSEAERFWSWYYWLARFAREWQAFVGRDADGDSRSAGLEVGRALRYQLRPAARGGWGDRARRREWTEGWSTDF